MTDARQKNQSAQRKGERPVTVLVVEDQVLVRYPVSEYLRRCGYRVFEAPNGEDAQVLFASCERIFVALLLRRHPKGCAQRFA